MFRNDPSLAPFIRLTDAAALSAQRNARWRPGMARKGEVALHSELFAASCEAGGAAAALALAIDDWRHTPRGEGQEVTDRRGVLWVQTREAARLAGQPYRAGLPKDLRGRLIHVLANRTEDALFALEEGLRCRDLAFVIGEIAANPRALDFTASRRLTLAIEKHGVPLFLVRLDAERDLSSARMRWEVASAPSAPRAGMRRHRVRRSGGQSCFARGTMHPANGCCTRWMASCRRCARERQTMMLRV